MHNALYYYSINPETFNMHALVYVYILVYSISGNISNAVDRVSNMKNAIVPQNKMQYSSIDACSAKTT